ncbi:TadE/TadG family type IV pilus assembly protein [Roseixanthobacter liquoris]|uniref:TadE/TadG family type IV pilus assembly protein n=1 Tax=Roseixanthobacter liquoris TaxID=3119921 RepID=UPI0037286906
MRTEATKRRGLCRLGAWIAAFARNQSGATAVTFGLMMIPLIGAGGLAVDYARLSLGRVQLQEAVDSAGLTLVHLARSTSDAELEEKAGDWIQGRLAGKGFGPITVVAERTGTKITFSASTTVELTLFSVINDQPVPISASNEVDASIGKVEIALVLDNTGSMVTSGTQRLANLKTAGKSLADRLEAAATDPSQVKVAVVPFSMTVNVGSQYATASWMDVNGLSPINKELFYSKTAPNNQVSPSRFTLFANISTPWAGCVEGRPIPYDVQETPPSTATPATLFVPYFAVDEPDSNSVPGGGSSYNDYLNDYGTGETKSTVWRERQGRIEKYNRRPVRTGANSTTGYTIGPNAGCSLQPLLRLTSDMEAVRDKIDALTAVGDTNVALGLIWGWHVLSPYGPFGDGVAYGTPNITKYVVLMTDGENANFVTTNTNKSIYSGVGYIGQGRLGITTGTAAQRTTAMNARLTLLCTNMKAVGIEIFTVGLEVSSDVKPLLKQCASNDEMFLDVTKANDLNDAFDQIGDKISQLRLSK